MIPCTLFHVLYLWVSVTCFFLAYILFRSRNNSVPSFNLSNGPISQSSTTTFGLPSATANINLPSATTNIASPLGQPSQASGSILEQPQSSSTSSFGAVDRFKFGSCQPPTTATQTNGFGFGATSLKPTSSVSTIPSIPQAQTQSGIPYLYMFHIFYLCSFPKETKFVDLPTDVRTAIESLEKTIRKYESDSCQLSSRHLQDIESFNLVIENLDKKLNLFEFTLNQSRGKLLLAKRSLNQYWKFGESVARYAAGMKQASTSGTIENLSLTLADFKFVESIIFDLEKREYELEHLYLAIKNNLEYVQSQSRFSVGTFKSVIKSNGEALINLTTAYATLRKEIELLRDEYRKFNLVHRNDSRDPFSPKVSTTSNQPVSVPAATPLIAPSLTSLIPQSQPASLLSLPSAATFIKRSS